MLGGKAALVLLSVFLLWPLPGNGAESCQTYKRLEFNALDGSASSFSNEAAVAIKVCSMFQDSYREHFILSDIERSRASVCSYRQQQIYKIESDRTARWQVISPTEKSATPIVTYMALSSGECPSYDSVEYTQTYGVEEDEYLQAIQIWHALLASIGEKTPLPFQRLIAPSEPAAVFIQDASHGLSEMTLDSMSFRDNWKYSGARIYHIDVSAGRNKPWRFYMEKRLGKFEIVMLAKGVD